MLNIALVLLSSQLFAQSPVVALSATYVSTSTSVSSYVNTPAPNSNSFTSCSSTNYTYTYNNGSSNALKLLNITVGAKNFFISNTTPATIKLRRVNNVNVTGQRSIIFLESTVSPTSNCPSSNRFDFKSPYNDVMENFLNNNYINQGTDNIFTNASNSDGNNNDIERVDVIFSSGLMASSTTDAGFAIFDRGNNNAHDPFRIAAITSLDVNGDPASFGAVKTCVGGNGSNNGSWGHPSIANGNVNLAVYVMRKEETETQLRASAAINQQLGGVFFSFADLGIAANQKIYGYALLGPDGTANPTSSQLLNINDATVYPTNTTEGAGGGLDMVAVNAIFSTGGNVLAVDETMISGKVEKDNVTINWSIRNAAFNSIVSLEKSENARDFFSVYTIPASDFTKGSFTEKSKKGEVYYRLKIKPAIGSYYFSNVIKLNVQNVSSLQLYPNRLSPNQVFVIENVEDGTYKALFCSSDGKTISGMLNIQSGRATINQLQNNLSAGMYWLNLVGKNNELYKAGKIVIN